MDVFKKPEGVISIFTATTVVGVTYFFHMKNKEIYTQMEKLSNGYNRLAETLLPVKNLQLKSEENDEVINVLQREIRTLKRTIRSLEEVKNTQTAIIEALKKSSIEIEIPEQKSATPQKKSKKKDKRKKSSSKSSRRRDETDSEDNLTPSESEQSLSPSDSESDDDVKSVIDERRRKRASSSRS